MLNYKDRQCYGKRPGALLISGTEHYKYAAGLIEDGSTVLDVGAGFCALKPYLKCVEYVGIDSEPWVCEAGGALLANLQDYDRVVDYVVMFGVLETSPDPEADVKHAISLARKMVIHSAVEETVAGLRGYSQKQLCELFNQDITYKTSPMGWLGAYRVREGRNK